ncbi:hypothetical protein ACN6LM_001484 [Streptomyces sp. SAS_281]|uniref:hypothetical protein n=1 Tax=Streptomyces sp. SAS_281 TaxID=3412744 RepID=UPI00403C1011
MKDTPYPYDTTLYSRLFLNCYQRQSLVMLAERGRPVHRLLFRGLVSTDEILRQVIREQRPKYDFESGIAGQDDLAHLGVVKEEAAFESYAEARDLLLDVVAREGYAILVGDVFYWPHCPEYRKQHLVHTIVLTGHDADTGHWDVVDDNPASLLCSYRYPEDVIAASFDNGALRRLRSYATKDLDPGRAEQGTRAAFAALLDGHRDSHELLTGAADLISCAWIARERVVASLHAAFSLYQGSRTVLREYLRHAGGDPAADDLLDRLVRGASEVMNHLLLAQVTGALDARWTADACLGLRRDERELLPRLHAAAGAAGRA